MSTPPMSVGPLIHLRTLEPFRTLSPAQLTLLTHEAEEVGFAADSWLVPPDDSIDAMFMVIDGFVRLVEDGKSRTLGPWSLVGYPEVLVRDTAELGIRAETDVVALRLETDALRELCERNFGILSALLDDMGDRLAADVGRLERSISAAGAPIQGPYQGPLDRVGRMVALQRARLLPRESMDALAELADRVDRIELGAGDPLHERDAPATEFHVVCTGALELRAPGRPPLSVGVGATPGLPETLGSVGYVHEVVASRDSTVLRVALDPFMDVLEDHFELGYSILGLLGEDVVAPPGSTAGDSGPR